MRTIPDEIKAAALAKVIAEHLGYDEWSALTQQAHHQFMLAAEVVFEILDEHHT